MDALDCNLLSELLKNGRATLTDLAAQFELSIPSITERIKKLEKAKVIQGYAATVDYQQLGFALTAVVFVTLAHPQYRADFIQQVQNTAEVLECLHVTGDDDYMLKVVCVNSKHLDYFLNERIKSIPGIMRTRTIIVLSAPKERAVDIPEVIKEGLK